MWFRSDGVAVELIRKAPCRFRTIAPLGARSLLVTIFLFPWGKWRKDMNYGGIPSC